MSLPSRYFAPRYFAPRYFAPRYFGTARPAESVLVGGGVCGVPFPARARTFAHVAAGGLSAGGSADLVFVRSVSAFGGTTWGGAAPAARVPSRYARARAEDEWLPLL